MPRLKRRIYRIVTAIHLFIDHWLYRLRLVLGLGTQAPIVVIPYISYGRRDYVYLQGRVLKEKRIVSKAEDSDWKNLWNNLKRAWSVEIREAELEITVGDNRFLVKTDKEGFFILDASLESPLPPSDELWREAVVKLMTVPWRTIDVEVKSRFIVPIEPQIAIVSDIDDTIIETKVNSLLKLKMLYLAFFKNANKRSAFSGVSAFFQALHEGGSEKNPVFYVSKSPWNIADQIELFIELNQLPLGPLLLRDYGLPYKKIPPDYKGHKYENIARIIRTYPDIPFLLIGDSGEQDIDIYLSITKAFPGRIKCIFIHNVRNSSGIAKIQKKIEVYQEVDIQLIESYDEAAHYASEKGWIDWEYYQSLIVQKSK